MSDLVFVNKRVVGRMDGRVFVQEITARHIFRQEQAKGMDKFVHRELKGRCDTWRLIFQDTKQVLEIPFGEIEKVKLTRLGRGAGEQYLVPLARFQEIRAIMQTKLI